MHISVRIATIFFFNGLSSWTTKEWEVTRRTPSDAPLREAYPPTACPHRRPAEGDPEKSPPCRDYRRLRPSVPHHLITLLPSPSHRVVRLQSGFPRDAYVGLVREIMSYDVNTPSDDFDDDLSRQVGLFSGSPLAGRRRGRAVGGQASRRRASEGVLRVTSHSGS